MKIYANGCSFVMGQELVDNDPLNIDNTKTAFPALIEAHNDAWSGSSNQAIANRTVEYCNRVKPDIAIISNPTSLHLESAKRLIPHVKGILIEKPLSNSLTGVDQLINLIKKK